MAHPRVRLGILFLFGIGSIVGCARSAGGEGSPLGDTHWRLVELNGRPAVPTEGEREAHLRFSDDSARVGGSTGCNRLTGPFTREGATLRFGPAVTTKMACLDPRLNEQEQAFVGALQSTQRYEIAADTLTLIGAAGPVARLEARR